MKKENKKTSPVILPGGFFCAGYNCGDCIHMDLNDQNKHGECYCKEKGKYYAPSDRTCGSFIERK